MHTLARTSRWQLSAMVLLVAVAVPQSANAQDDDITQVWRQAVAEKQADAFPIVDSGYTLFLPTADTDMLGGLPLNYAEGTGNGFDFILGTPGVELAWFFGTSGTPVAQSPGICSQRAPVCGGQRDDGSWIEQYTGLSVNGLDAIVTHSSATISAPEGWVILWFDPDQGMTYRFGLYEQLARDLGTGLDPQGHEPAAHRLEGIASSLVPVTFAPGED